MTSLNVLVPHFERLLALPEHERAAALAELPLDEAARARLARMLAADADREDALARVIADSAGSAQGMPAEQLGPYRLLREIGAGGMGTVFLAERVDGQFTRQVAIKLLRGFPTRDASRRLRRERQILAGLDHPNIARLLDGGETADGQPWLAMEHVDGVQLLRYVARHAPGLRERLALFDAMLDAVAHAHRHLIVHRDLKPANVLVTHDGVVKLLDFGIARLLDASVDSERRETSTRVYSRGYASPEQQEGGAITTASDIYSLGVMLRELVTGMRESGGEALVAPLPLDADLAGIIAKAGAHEPEQRYASAAEFAADLRRYRDGRPVHAARWTRRYRLRKFAVRHRIGIAAAVLAAVVLAGFIWRLDQERNRAVAAEAVAMQARAAAERDAASARASLDFLTAAFAAAAPENALSRQVSVRSLLDAARAQLDVQKDAVVAKTMQRLLAHLYADLGEATTALDLMRTGLTGMVPANRAEALRLADDFDEYSSLLGIADDGAGALSAARTAQQWREQFAPDDAVERLRSLNALALAHHRNGEDAVAVNLLREAMKQADGGPAVALELYVDIAQSLSALLAAAGEGGQALAAADRGLRRVDAERSRESPERVTLLRSKASAMTAIGNPAAAEKLLREAITLQDRVVASGGSRMMVLTNDLGLVLNDLGRYREAADLLRQSDRLMNDARLDSATERATSRTNLAGVFENAGDYAGALAQFDEAMKILGAGGVDADHQVRRRIARAQARTLGIVGQYDRAHAMLVDLRQRCARIEGEHSGEYAMLVFQLALLERRRHQPEVGLPLLDEAERRWHALVPEAHPIFLHARRMRAAFALDRGLIAAAASELEAAVAGFQASGALPVDLAIARSELADVRARQGQDAEARKLLKQALPDLRSALLPGEVSRAAAERLALRVGAGG
ncbi:MAG: serine/threonine protein kinase [Proteobacteria bacterium]|nr:serine/threonine protein kinase [Pseudomonadota bacterium]